jgi:hypothetical protein
MKYVQRHQLEHLLNFKIWVLTLASTKMTDTRQQAPLKRPSVPTNLHGVPSQNIHLHFLNCQIWDNKENQFSGRMQPIKKPRRLNHVYQYLRLHSLITNDRNSLFCAAFTHRSSLAHLTSTCPWNKQLVITYPKTTVYAYTQQSKLKKKVRWRGNCHSIVRNYHLDFHLSYLMIMKLQARHYHQILQHFHHHDHYTCR